MAGFVTHVNDVQPVADAADTVTTRTTIDESVGAERLIQAMLTFTAGTSSPRSFEDRDEVAYVVSGNGSLILDGVSHQLNPDIGVYLRAGESYQVVNDGPDDLVLVSVTAPPPEEGELPAMRQVTVDTADQPVIPAGKDREFKFVINPDAGCQEVTQFVGWIPPGRAPTHYHLYDEVMYILDGEGVLHLEGQPDTPIRPGTCIHLPPPVEHCVENTGERLLRVLGVFHPAGDASEAYEEEAMKGSKQ
jgi:mannose-6-phosphate isomerase-like protein (cupin superfamily)